jgi:hypothetical protein
MATMKPSDESALSDEVQVELVTPELPETKSEDHDESDNT